MTVRLASSGPCGKNWRCLNYVVGSRYTSLAALPLMSNAWLTRPRMSAASRGHLNAMRFRLRPAHRCHRPAAAGGSVLLGHTDILTDDSHAPTDGHIS